MENMKHANENKLMKRYTRKVIITNKKTGDKGIDCAKYLNYNKSTITNTCKVILESAAKLQCEAYKYMIHGLISGG
jgi:hypothetical protein